MIPHRPGRSLVSVKPAGLEHSRERGKPSRGVLSSSVLQGTYLQAFRSLLRPAEAERERDRRPHAHRRNTPPLMEHAVARSTRAAQHRAEREHARRLTAAHAQREQAIADQTRLEQDHFAAQMAAMHARNMQLQQYAQPAQDLHTLLQQQQQQYQYEYHQQQQHLGQQQLQQQQYHDQPYQQQQAALPHSHAAYYDQGGFTPLPPSHHSRPSSSLALHTPHLSAGGYYSPAPLSSSFAEEKESYEPPVYAPRRLPPLSAPPTTAPAAARAHAQHLNGTPGPPSAAPRGKGSVARSQFADGHAEATHAAEQRLVEKAQQPANGSVALAPTAPASSSRQAEATLPDEEEWIVRRNGPLPASTASVGPRSSRQYTLRRNGGADVLSNLSFPKAVSDDASAAAAAAPTPAPKRSPLNRTATTSATRAPLPPQQQPQPQPPLTIFDEPDQPAAALESAPSDPSAESGLSTAAAEGSSVDAAAGEASVGFRASGEEDLMDLYFYLASAECPIFRTQAPSAHAAIAAATTTTINPASIASSVPSTPRKWNPYADEDEAVEQEASNPTFPSTLDLAAPPAELPLAERVGLDLGRLSALVEASGGLVSSAFAYLEHLVPVSVSSGSVSTTTRPLLDPFAHMDELVHTVRAMRERDQQAGIPPPPRLNRYIGRSAATGHTPLPLPPRHPRPDCSPRTFRALHGPTPQPQDWPHETPQATQHEARLTAQQLLGFSQSRLQLV